MVAIYERERPKSFSEIAGFADVVQRLENLNECLGMSGQSFFITGRSGVGKTTIARIIASMVADPVCSYEVDAQDVSIDLLRDWKDKCQIKPLFSEAYAFIVNEAHTLSNRAVSFLQTLLEDDRVQANSTWVFTTTDVGTQTDV